MDDNVNNTNNRENEDSIAEDKKKVAAKEAKGSETVSKDARMWAMFCHLAGLCGYILPVVGNIVGPLVFWRPTAPGLPFAVPSECRWSRTS